MSLNHDGLKDKNGYFEGVMFDYEIEDEYGEMGVELYKYTEKTIDRIIDIYEKELERFSTHKLKRVVTFSSGETIYKAL